MTKPDISRQDTALSVEQDMALMALLEGATDEAAAARAGVSRQTVSQWRHDEPAFIAELNRRRVALWDTHTDRLRSLLLKAIDTVAGALDSEDERVRMQAAAQLLKVAGVGGLRPTGPMTERAAANEVLLRSS